MKDRIIYSVCRRDSLCVCKFICTAAALLFVLLEEKLFRFLTQGVMSILAGVTTLFECH